MNTNRPQKFCGEKQKPRIRREQGEGGCILEVDNHHPIVLWFLWLGGSESYVGSADLNKKGYSIVVYAGRQETSESYR